MAIKFGIAGVKDRAHAALTQLVEQMVPAGQQRHGGGGRGIGRRRILTHSSVPRQTKGARNDCRRAGVDGSTAPRGTRSYSRPTKSEERLAFLCRCGMLRT